MSEQQDHVECEACGLPHALVISECEDCGHAIGRAPDWQALEAKRASLGGQIVAGITITLAMLLLNFSLFGSAGYIIALGPVVWMGTAAYQYRALSTALARRTAR